MLASIKMVFGGRGVADSLENAGERLFIFLRYPPQPLDLPFDLAA